jgi:hypothetical protein
VGDAVRRTAVLVGVMLLALSACTLRNYVLSGRVVPVNAQFWLSIWPAAIRSSDPDPNRYRWKEIRRPFRRLLKRVALGTERTDPYGVSDNLRVEEAARRSVLASLSRSPRTYLGNVLDSFYSYHVHVNSILIGLYRYVQTPGRRLKSWYWPGQDQEAYASPIAGGFEVLLSGLSLVALAGLLWSLRAGGPPLLATASVHVCLALAHSITWMDLMYYFTKWPFVIVFAFACLQWALRSRTLSVGGRRRSWADVVGWSIALLSVALTAALLI